MSSTERAPEPTMEEILASIRRIISDDEAKQESAAPEPEEESLELVQSEADDRIIDDIARVLSEGNDDDVAEAGEEDILDLTAELGGLEPVEDEPLPLEAESAAEPETVEDLIEDEPISLELVELEAAPEFIAEPAPESQAELQAASPPQPEPAPQPQHEPPRQMSASEEAASALERAIAALKAGQVPTSAPQYGMQPSAPPVFNTEPFVPPQPQPAPQAPVFSMPAPAPEPEPQPVVSVTETIVEMVTAELLPAEDDELAAQEDEAASSGFWPPEQVAQPAAVKTNGLAAHAAPSTPGSSKTLEDSIKDMLRPMLQQWLDENMARVLTAALKDEIQNDPARFQAD